MAELQRETSPTFRRPAALSGRRWAAWSLSAAAAAVVTGVFLVVSTAPVVAPSSVRLVLYEIQRDWRHSALLAAVSEFSVLESRHFILHFDEALDLEWAPAVLECAEAARVGVARRLGWSVVQDEDARSKVHLILYPDRRVLARQFGAESGFQALGAYWCDVIQLLSPRLWLGPAPSVGATRLFWTNGPMVHEYTHYLLDQLIPGGNYPRWLSEGLAQYVDYRETGYVWVEPANDIRPPVDHASLYSLDELERWFDRLSNPALAYRQAFLLTAYLEERVGWAGINELLRRLSAGEAFDKAFPAIVGVERDSLERDWHAWLDLILSRPPLGGDSGEEARSG